MAATVASGLAQRRTMPHHASEVVPVRLSVLVAVLALSAVSAVAQQVPNRLTLSFDVPYEECVFPAGVRCLFAEGATDKCRPCEIWRKRYLQQETVAPIDRYKYRYSQWDTNNTAGMFVYDVSRIIANEPWAMDVKRASSFAALWENPEEYGFLSVDPKKTQTDGFLVTPKMGGVVGMAENDGKAGQNFFWVSNTNQGALRMTEDPSPVFGHYAMQARLLVPAPKPDPRPPALHWNAWAQNPAPNNTERLTKPLTRGDLYEIVFALADRPYGDAVSGPVGAEVLKYINDWLLNNPNQDTAPLHILLLTDDHLEVQGSPFIEKTVDLKAIRAWVARSAAKQDEPSLFDAANYPTEGKKSQFKFAGSGAKRVQPSYFETADDPAKVQVSPFRLEIAEPAAKRDELPAFLEAPFTVLAAKPGRAAVTFSIWDNAYRPIGEATATFCVEPCEEGAAALTAGMMGLDSVHAAETDNHGRIPGAAMHFVAVGSDVRGVLHIDGAPKGEEFLAWPLGLRLKDFLAKITRLTDGFGKPGNSAEERWEKANELRDTLFPERFNLAANARDRFGEFLDRHASLVPPKGAQAKSVFVRLHGNVADALGNVPIALYPVRKSRRKDELDYLGFFLRVENPLEIQNYDRPTACLNKWFLAFSNVGQVELKAAGTWVEQNVLSSWQNYKWFPTFAKEEDSTRNFKVWAGTKADDALPEAVIYILGHHDGTPGKNRLVLNGDDELWVDDFKRTFAKPSVAILNACGTAGPAAGEFVRVLNRNNVGAVIATKYQIPFEMAAQFTGCLAKYIVAPSDLSNFNLSYAFFDALHCLRIETPFDETLEPMPGEPAWAGQALAYSLIGNGGMPVCSPGGP